MLLYKIGLICFILSGIAAMYFVPLIKVPLDTLGVLLILMQGIGIGVYATLYLIKKLT